MKKSIIIGLLLLSGCAANVRIGVLHDFQDEIGGDNPMAILDVQYPVAEGVTCGYTHISHFTSGVPFNNRKEDIADALGCYFQIK